MLLLYKNSKKQPESAEIADFQEEEVFSQDETPMVRLTVALPQISGGVPLKAAQKINDYYKLAAQRLKQHANGALLKEARAAYAQCQDEGNPFWQPYALSVAYTVTFNQDGVLSLHCDITQSVRQNSVLRYGDTWCLTEGLPHLVALPPRRKALQRIRRMAAQRETQRPGAFRPGFRAALARHYDDRDCYLAPTGSVVFYPMCTVAPHGEGIVEFAL